jgi:hypothetical protein
VITEAKKREADNLILSATNKQKTLWKIINKETGKFRQKPNIVINTGDKLITNPQTITEKFSSYFIEITEDLLSQVNHYFPQQHSTFYMKNCSETIFIAPTTETELIQIIKDLKNNSSTGFDEIPTFLVKQCLCHFIKPLVHIYNTSFQTGTFPDLMKIAKVKLLHKKQNRQDIQNYRPISILSVFFKLLEKLMHKRLLLFVKKHSTLTSEKHGFTEGKSTETASQSFIQDVQEALDKHLYVVGVFLDLSKAYDVINHKG